MAPPPGSWALGEPSPEHEMAAVTAELENGLGQAFYDIPPPVPREEFVAGPFPDAQGELPFQAWLGEEDYDAWAFRPPPPPPSSSTCFYDEPALAAGGMMWNIGFYDDMVPPPFPPQQHERLHPVDRTYFEL